MASLSEVELAQQRQALREQFWAAMATRGVDTDEAREAVDIVMDVAADFPIEEGEQAAQITLDWNNWVMNQTFATVEERLRLRGKDGDGADE